MKSETLLRQYTQEETEDNGFCCVELYAIGWELYEIRVNEHAEQRIVGLDQAFTSLEDYVNMDDPSWRETFNCNDKSVRL